MHTDSFRAIRVLIADDHELVREGLKKILRTASDIVVAGEARNGSEVADRVREPGDLLPALDDSRRHGRSLVAGLLARAVQLANGIRSDAGRHGAAAHTWMATGRDLGARHRRPPGQLRMWCR